MLSDYTLYAVDEKELRLNAPSGAGCFLTGEVNTSWLVKFGLNAPSGAGCFLTPRTSPGQHAPFRLNAPSGAGCFLTPALAGLAIQFNVLMHLLVLGAF